MLSMSLCSLFVCVCVKETENREKNYRRKRQVFKIKFLKINAVLYRKIICKLKKVFRAFKV